MVRSATIQCTLTTLVLLSLCAPTYGQYDNVEIELQQIFEQVTGGSYADAVHRETMALSKPALGNGNVFIRFNGGKWNNKVFAGEGDTNLVEFLVVNDAPLRALDLGFHFYTNCGSCSFSFIEGHGSYPTSGSPPYNILDVNPSAFEFGVPWFTIIDTGDPNYPGKFHIGGVDFTAGNEQIAAHFSPIVLYTMKLVVELPPSVNEVPGGFCIDNITFGPPHYWTFTELVQDSPPITRDYAPHFQSNPNSATDSPDAPPVCIDIVRRCYVTGTSPSILPLDSAEAEPAKSEINLLDHPGVTFDANGTALIRAYMTYLGDKQDLEALGVWISPIEKSNNRLSVRFPVALLPQVASLEGMERLAPPPRVKLHLDHSKAMIEADTLTLHPHYAAGIDGDGVVLGIIDTGVDWGHEIGRPPLRVTILSHPIGRAPGFAVTR